jgi:hypothetical protein
MPVPDDDGNPPFELRKDSEFLKGYVNFEDARADCDKGNRQKSATFEVWSKGQRVYPE